MDLLQEQRKEPLFGSALEEQGNADHSPQADAPCVPPSNCVDSPSDHDAGDHDHIQPRIRGSTLVRAPSAPSLLSKVRPVSSLRSSVSSLFRIGRGGRNAGLDCDVGRDRGAGRERDTVTCDRSKIDEVVAAQDVAKYAGNVETGSDAWTTSSTSMTSATLTNASLTSTSLTSTSRMSTLPPIALPLRRSASHILNKSSSVPELSPLRPPLTHDKTKSRQQDKPSKTNAKPPLRMLPRRNNANGSTSSFSSACKSLASSPSSSAASSTIFEPEGKPMQRVPSLPDLKVAVKSIARHGALGQLKRGASKAHIPYVSVPELDETRVPAMAFKKFREQCRSGDLILVSSGGPVGRMLRRVSNSVYSHVMMIYREGTTGADGPVRLFNSMASPGFDVRRNTQTANETQLNDPAFLVNLGGHIIWRPLHTTGERLQEVHARMDEMIDELCGVPYPSRAMFMKNYMRGMFGWEKADDPDQETRFCSELMALVLMNTGLLKPDVVPWSFSPPMFSEALHKRLDERMVAAKYGREHQLLFDEEDRAEATVTVARHAAIVKAQAEAVAVEGGTASATADGKNEVEAGSDGRSLRQWSVTRLRMLWLDLTCFVLMLLASATAVVKLLIMWRQRKQLSPHE